MSRHARLIVALAVADVVNVEIEMVAPKKWWHREGFPRPQNISSRSLALSLRYHPMFHPDATGTRIGPARNIAGGENSWHICFQKFIYQHAIVGGNAGFFSQCCI